MIGDDWLFRSSGQVLLSKPSFRMPSAVTQWLWFFM